MPLSLIGTIAGLGLGAVGTGMELAGQAKARSAMKNTRAQEVAKQAAIQDQASQLFNRSLSQSSPATAAAQMAAGTAARTSAWNNLKSATAPIASALPATASGTPDARRAQAAGNAWNTLTANSAATQGGYGDWQTQQAIKNADIDQRIGVLNNEAQGDAGLLPLELQVAGQSGDKLSGWGGIVSSLGNIAGLASATGAFSAPTRTQSVPDAHLPALDTGNLNIPANGPGNTIWQKIYGD